MDLAKFAKELDEDERIRMLEGGSDSAQYLRFVSLPLSLVYNLCALTLFNVYIFIYLYVYLAESVLIQSIWGGGFNLIWCK